MLPTQLKPTIVPIPGHDAHTIQQKSATTASMMMKQTFTFSDKLSGSLRLAVMEASLNSSPARCATTRPSEGRKAFFSSSLLIMLRVLAAAIFAQKSL
jgi:hypothetical protein